MKLSDLLNDKKYSEIEIDRVDYAEKDNQVHFHLSVDNITEEQKTHIKNDLRKSFEGAEILISYSVKEKVSDFYEPAINIQYSPKKKKSDFKEKDEGFVFGKFSKKDTDNIIPLSEISLETALCLTQGVITSFDGTVTKNGYYIVKFSLEDSDGGAVSCKSFYKEKDKDDIESCLKIGVTVIAKGILQYDTYEKDNVFMIKAVKEGVPVKSVDSADVKRVEFTVHTQMTNMEGIVDHKALKKRLKEWEHEAVGITDFGSVQAYPPVYEELKGSGIKLLFGYHTNIINSEHKILTDNYDKKIDDNNTSYTVFDIETTGFSRFNDAIIEIGAVRYENGIKVGEFDEFVYPERNISERISELTGITDIMVQNADTIDKVFPRFLEFSKDSVYVAHNADFDLGFMIENAHRLGIKFEPIYIDTLGLARCLHPEYKNHKLDTLAKELNVDLLNHHRACDDAEATGGIFLKLLKEWRRKKIKMQDINKTISAYPVSKHETFEGIIYVKVQSGLKNLYKIVSEANLEYFFRAPGIPWENFVEKRDGLIFMTGMVGSKLFEAISRRFPHKKLLEIAGEADVLCVQPPDYWEKAVRNELVADENHYKEFIKKIISLGEELNIPCIAVGTPYYLDKGERLARNILVNFQRNLDFEFNSRYRMLNTTEMLNAFSWLGKDKAYEIVVQATNDLKDTFEDIIPIPEGTFTPKLEGADEELRELTYKNAHRIYGEKLPEIVEERLERELASIIGNGYSSLYVIAEKLVKKSNEDGYLVGSRGSVGSSFAAAMAGITEVNALIPHYVCPKCKHSEFIDDGSVGSGFDLPEKECPHCNTMMKRDGQDIPFEVFLGFKGDKEPDIDLNFAGVYMPTIHKYTEELFGSGKVFRAGTISGVQNKTAYGFIKKYLEQKYIPEEDQIIPEARKKSLQRIMEDTKRTSGQHAGGLMIVPRDMDIYDFCPIQYPADDVNSDVITTHFSYKNLSGRMLKLDELGHTSPTIIRQLQEMTGIDPLGITFDDPDTMAIFSDAETLNSKHAYSNSNDGSLGIPEFGTDFVRGMLKDTKPKTFAELTRISGLSHGTNVWLHNAQDLIRDGVTDLPHSICTRDDIMIYLISMGMDKLESFKTMEAVRKGKGIPNGTEPHMREHGVPEWYIDSCNKISYMFPKAHAAAYVMMSYRIAWFKVHSPAAFYATYYTQRLSDFSTRFIFKSLEMVQSTMQSMKQDSVLEGIEIDGAKWTLLEVIEEMYARDLKFAPVDLYKSAANVFTIIDETTVLPPLSSLDDVSEAMAESIVAARKNGDFMSREELKLRTNLTKNAMQSLSDYGAIDFLPETNQMSFLAGF